MPEPATRIDGRIVPQIVGRGVEVPQDSAGRGVGREDEPALATVIEGFRSARDGADLDGAVEHQRSHRDAFVAIALDECAPDLFAGVLPGDDGDGGSTQREECHVVTGANTIRSTRWHRVVVDTLVQTFSPMSLFRV